MDLGLADQSINTYDHYRQMMILALCLQGGQSISFYKRVYGFYISEFVI